MLLKLLLHLFFQICLAQTPSRMDALNEKLPKMNGPNCWNAALYVTHLIESMRYSSPEELAFWLNSKYCKKIQDSEQIQAGDIVALRSHEGELHAMLWLKDNMVFSKNTSHRLDPYQKIEAPLIFSMFRVNESICQQPRSEYSQACSRWTDYYHCESSQADRIRELNLNDELRNFYEHSHRMNQQIEKIIFSGTPNSKDFDVLKLRLHDLQTKMAADAKRKDTQISFFTKALFHEAESLRVQIDLLKSPR